MKKILFILITVALCFSFTNCSDDEWSEGDPAMEHIYYVGFQDWGKLKNDVVYNVNRGLVVAIPIQFHSERTRSYDVATYYYVTATSLVLGTDYQVVDAAGNTLQADAKGAYVLNWPNAVKGVQDVYLKALNGKSGTVIVHTFDPSLGAIEHPNNITNSMTNDYEVRAFSQNYKVTVNLK